MIKITSFHRFNLPTAPITALNDLLMNMDKGHESLLLLMDLSTAFDHGISLQTLQTKLGVCGGTALFWLKSYLEGRSDPKKSA